jgi:hypothetical protein
MMSEMHALSARLHVCIRTRRRTYVDDDLTRELHIVCAVHQQLDAIIRGVKCTVNVA